MTWIKVCGTTNLEDARVAVECGADALGFIFAPSPRRIAPEAARAIMRELPQRVEKVGVFVNEDPGRIVEIVARAGLTAVQLHGGERVEDYTKQLFPGGKNEKGLRLYRALPLQALLDAAERTANSAVDAVLVDSGSPGQGGTGQRFDWERAAPLVASLREKTKIIIAGGLTPETVAHAVARFRPWGVDVVSGVEREPGKKDHHAVRAFIAAVKAAECEIAGQVKP